ncbi:MAG TPA: cytochrome C oxidase subunit IV family protein [Opitutaceae bacterium]|nr:cytochrome C oxidase subunit IV family protein [Opitutaceae bacterium]
MNSPHLTLRVVFTTYIGLMILLTLTALTTFSPFGVWRTPISLLIAAVKMSLIFLFFMQLRYRTGLIRIFAAAGFFWLLLMATLDFADYLTR